MVIGALGMIPKSLVRGLEELKIRGRVETIQIAALLKSLRILRKVLDTCYHPDSSERQLTLV